MSKQELYVAAMKINAMLREGEESDGHLGVVLGPRTDVRVSGDERLMGGSGQNSNHDSDKKESEIQSDNGNEGAEEARRRAERDEEERQYEEERRRQTERWHAQRAEEERQYEEERQREEERRRAQRDAAKQAEEARVREPRDAEEARLREQRDAEEARRREQRDKEERIAKDRRLEELEDVVRGHQERETHEQRAKNAEKVKYSKIHKYELDHEQFLNFFGRGISDLLGEMHDSSENNVEHDVKLVHRFMKSAVLFHNLLKIHEYVFSLCSCIEQNSRTQNDFVHGYVNRILDFIKGVYLEECQRLVENTQAVGHIQKKYDEMMKPVRDELDKSGSYSNELEPVQDENMNGVSKVVPGPDHVREVSDVSKGAQGGNAGQRQRVMEPIKETSESDRSDDNSGGGLLHGAGASRFDDGNGRSTWSEVPSGAARVVSEDRKGGFTRESGFIFEDEDQKSTFSESRSRVSHAGEMSKPGRNQGVPVSNALTKKKPYTPNGKG